MTLTKEQLDEIEKRAKDYYNSFGKMSPPGFAGIFSEDILEKLIPMARKALKYEKALKNIQKHVDEQCEDVALWSLPCDADGKLLLQPIGEAYLQQELRSLHSTIENNMEALKEKE